MEGNGRQIASPSPDQTSQNREHESHGGHERPIADRVARSRGVLDVGQTEIECDIDQESHWPLSDGESSAKEQAKVEALALKPALIAPD